MQIIKGKIPCAKKVLIYGPEGIGKSTFAAQFPEPVLLIPKEAPKTWMWRVLKRQVAGPC